MTKLQMRTSFFMLAMLFTFLSGLAFDRDLIGQSFALFTMAMFTGVYSFNGIDA